MNKSNNSVLSKEENPGKDTLQVRVTSPDKRMYASPMVPIHEDDSDMDSPPSFNLKRFLAPANREHLYTEIQVGFFEGTCENPRASPSYISNFSTSKATGNQKSKNSKYLYEIDTESLSSSSEEALSYEEGRSANAYSDIMVEGKSKTALANLRRKTVYLAAAPLKLCRCQRNEDSDVEISDEDCDHLSNQVPEIKKNLARRNTLFVRPFGY